MPDADGHPDANGGSHENFAGLSRRHVILVVCAMVGCAVLLVVGVVIGRSFIDVSPSPEHPQMARW